METELRVGEFEDIIDLGERAESVEDAGLTADIPEVEQGDDSSGEAREESIEVSLGVVAAEDGGEMTERMGQVQEWSLKYVKRKFV